MSNLIKKIDEIPSLPSRHSFFQLRYFLIEKEPTNQAKMWQCIRELKARRENLQSSISQIEEEKDKLELQDIYLQKLDKIKTEEKDELSLKETDIKIRQIKRYIESIKENINKLEQTKSWIEEESEFFYQTYKNIEETEPLKKYDDIDAQKEYWGTKLLEKINLKILIQNNIDIELIETALALPDDIPIKKQVLNKLNDIQANILKIQQKNI
jgi:hypothetical protein